MERSELGWWLRLVCTPDIGNGTARRLLTAFGSPAAVFDQDAATLAAIATARQREALLQVPEGFDILLESTWQWLQTPAAGEAQRRMLALGDAGYPPALLQMEDPPLLLHAMGCFDAWPAFVAPDVVANSLAIVGSRNPTPQGQANAEQFGRLCAAAGWTVVSGLAQGVDGAAHAGALKGAADRLGMLATVAVVGTGLDRVYPKSHLALAHAIARQGVILSEYTLGTPPIAANFPRRNRLIAGLSRGTLVVEAALRSGSLITARLASEQGKEVFAIPGSIHSPQARGCHALIQQGAKLVASADDIFDEFAPADALRPARAAVPIDATASVGQGADPDDLLAHIGFDPIGLDALSARTGLDAARLQARLLTLELDGHVVRLPGALFQRFVSA